MTQNSNARPASYVVVVAEDEPLIRIVAADRLTDAGFVVLEAEHADGALDILRSKAADIHILFTDIHMPGSMNGLQLAHHTHFHWPWIALLLASGRATPKPAEMPLGSRFLAKPYDPGHMLAHVKDMTASK